MPEVLGTNLFKTPLFLKEGDGIDMVQDPLSSMVTIHTTAGVILTSIADVRTLTVVTTATRVTTSSYWPGAFIGGGTYRYDATDTTTADNSSTVIVDGIGRRWKLVHDGAVLLSQFGAKFDGTDDLVYWNRAVAALNAGTVKLLDIDPYETTISAAPNYLKASNFEIRGHGNASRVTMQASTVSGYFLILGDYTGSVRSLCRNGKISGIFFTYNNVTNVTATEPFLWLRVCHTITIENVYVDNGTSIVRFGGETRFESAGRIVIDNLRAPGTVVSAGATALDFKSSTGVIVTNCVFGAGRGAASSTLSIAGVEGEFTVVLVSVAGLAIGYAIGVTYNDDQRLWYKVTNIVGTTVTISSGLSQAVDAGNLVQFYDPTPISARAVSFKPGATSSTGIDNVSIDSNTFNYRPSRQDYAFEYDCTYGGIANVFWNNNVIDGGMTFNTLYKIGAGIVVANRRITQIHHTGNRITSCILSGGGVKVDQGSNNLIHHVTYVGNTIGTTDGPIFQHVRSGGALTTESGFIFANNAYIDAGGAVARDLFITGSDTLTVIGGFIGKAKEITVPSWRYGLSFNAATVQNFVFQNVLGCDILTAKYPVDVSALNNSAGLMNGIISPNSGKPTGPIRNAQTTDATSTILGRQLLSVDGRYRLRCWVSAVKSDLSQTADWSLDAVITMTASVATVTWNGTVTVSKTDATWGDATIGFSTTTVRILGVGKAATTINWTISSFTLELLQ